MSKEQREYEAVWHLICALSKICCATPEMIIDALTGVLWSEDEAEIIKRHES